MTDSILSKAATMEIPINSNGDSRTAEDDSLEQVCVQCPPNEKNTHPIFSPATQLRHEPHLNAM